MSVSDPEEKIEWGAESEPRKNERAPSSVYCTIRPNNKSLNILAFALSIRIYVTHEGRAWVKMVRRHQLFFYIS
jgi:hypothetical protein